MLKAQVEGAALSSRVAAWPASRRAAVFAVSPRQQRCSPRYSSRHSVRGSARREALSLQSEAMREMRQGRQKGAHSCVCAKVVV